MKRSLLILAIILASVFSTYGQIEDEIQNSKKVKIENGRSYLIEKLMSKDYNKVKEVKDYLKELEDDDYCSFYLWEMWQILYWTSEFDVLKEEFAIDSTEYHATIDKIAPDVDQLNRRLGGLSVEYEQVLRSNLEEAQLSAEDYEIMTIFLDWNLKPITNENQKIINEEVDRFLAAYPESPYKWFAKNIIYRPYYEKSEWGYGIGLGFCSGFTTGKLHKPIFGIALDFILSYKKCELDLGIGVMGGNTRYDQTFDRDIYSKGSSVNCIFARAALSYNIIDNKSIRLAPSLGVDYYMEGYPNKEHKTITSLNRNFVLLGGGLVFDIKLNRGKSTMNNNYIRVRYNCGLAGKVEGEFSTLNTISVSWTGIVASRRYVK